MRFTGKYAKTGSVMGGNRSVGNVGRTLAWEVVGEVLLAIHATEPPDRAEWTAFVTSCRELGEVPYCLALSPDAQLDAMQRREIGELVRHLKVRKIAVITQSRVAQALVTALGWLTGKHKSFLPHQQSQLVAFLELTPSAGNAILQRAAALAEQLGNPVLTPKQNNLTGTG